MKNPFQNFFPNLFALVGRHKLLTAVLVLLCLVFAFFGYWIGFPQMVVLLAPVALIAWVFIAHRINSGKPQGKAEAIAACSYIALATVFTFVIIQAVPYGRSHSNGAVVGAAFEPTWKDAPGAASGTTRDLTVRACYGCHSNEVEYPSYAKVAPISWMVQSHVDGGRNAVNFSIFKKYGSQDRLGQRIIRVIQNGSMPPSYYTHLGKHPEAKLTDKELSDLINGLAATFGVSAAGNNGHNGDED